MEWPGVTPAQALAELHVAGIGVRLDAAGTVLLHDTQRPPDAVLALARTPGRHRASKRGHQLQRPIRRRPAATCAAMVSGNQVDRCRLCAASRATQGRQHGAERSITALIREQPDRQQRHTRRTWAAHLKAAVRPI